MKTTLSALHHQTTDWLRELQFYKDEIKILEGRLGEVATKNTAQEVLAQVEHFQNKFIMLNEQADVLKHDVKQAEGKVEEMAGEMPTHIHQHFEPVATALMARVADYTKSIAATRYELNLFLSKTM